MTTTKLLNKDNVTLSETYKEHLLEQYKLYVEMADRISQRRISINSFFITINSTIFTVLTFYKDKISDWGILIFLIGIIVSFSWFYMVNSYKQLNSAKFQVIHEMEKTLPASLYAFEWSKLGEGKEKKKYWPISHIEKIIPIIFAIIYLVGGIIYLLL